MEDIKKYLRTRIYLRRLYKAERKYFTANYMNDEEEMKKSLMIQYKCSVKHLYNDDKKKMRRLLNDEDIMEDYCSTKKLQLDAVYNSYGYLY